MMRTIALLLLTAGAMASPPKKIALVESTAMTAAEEALANQVVNEISTQEWSKNAMKLNVPTTDLEKDLAPVEAWYINADSATDKAKCMETQLTNAGYAPLRFSADDCVEKGCNHKKLFEALNAAPSQAEHFLVLEDTPVINTESIKKLIDDFLVHNDKDFSLLQLDPYGGVAKPTGFHRGRPLYSPSEDLANAKAYKGAHAMLVKKSALSQIVELMNKRETSNLEDLVLQLPTSMAMSGGVAINPMINKFQEKLKLPAHCEAATKSSFIEAQAAAEQDLWSLWPRENATTSVQNTVYWVPNARSWVSAVPKAEPFKVTESGSALLEVIQTGAHDEDPGRAVCFRDSLQARGLGTSKRMQLLEIPQACSDQTDAADYNACLARSGLGDCTMAGNLNLQDFDNVDWTRRLQVRDHVTKSTCGFQRNLQQVKDGEKPYVLILNENAVLGRDIKNEITSFIEKHPDDVNGKAWKAIQIDAYGREAPIDQGLGAAWSQERKGDNDAKIEDFKYLSDEEAKSRFWGMHAVLLKREAIPTILAELQQEDGTAIGAVDRIPRHTEGWLAASLGVAYDPHMAVLADECRPSRAEHFQVARAEIPEAWTTQKEA